MGFWKQGKGAFISREQSFEGNKQTKKMLGNMEPRKTKQAFDFLGTSKFISASPPPPVRASMVSG